MDTWLLKKIDEGIEIRTDYTDPFLIAQLTLSDSNLTLYEKNGVTEVSDTRGNKYVLTRIAEK